MNVHRLLLDFILAAHWRDGITLYQTTWHNTLIMMMDGWTDGYHYTFILILCFIFHCMLFKLLAVFILFWWLVSNSNFSLVLTCKTSVHKLCCVESFTSWGVYVFYGCLFLMHILQPKIFLCIYLKMCFCSQVTLYRPSVWRVGPLHHNVKDGLLKYCI